MKRPNIDKSRSLRRNQTDAERMLWSALRGRHLQGIKFRRQFPIDTFILDLYAPEHRLAVEIDGGQHYDDSAIQNDQARSDKLSAMGIRVLRFSNVEVLGNIQGVCEIILRTIESGGSPPHLIPLPPGERK
ncbi:MAG: endonuclease domain-containing protein [Nitrospirota bacterium]